MEKLSDERLSALRAATVDDNGKKLDLPPPNNLIATNFDILPEDASLSARPQLVKQWDGVADLWYKKDDRFNKPKAIVGCKIYTDDLNFAVSPEATVFAEVWKRVLQESLREFTYMADCAKLDFKIHVPRNNIDLQWSGFNDSLLNFVSETLQRINALKNLDCREIFNQVKEQLQQEWKNYYLNMVFRLAYAQVDTFLFENDYEKSVLNQILDALDYESFKSMQQQWLQKGRMLWFAFGNLTVEQAKQIVDQAVQLANFQPLPKEALPAVRCVDLSSFQNNFSRLDFTVEEPTNENSCLVSYYQYGLA